MSSVEDNLNLREEEVARRLEAIENKISLLEQYSLAPPTNSLVRQEFNDLFYSRIYSGAVNGNGTVLTTFPSGWSVERTSDPGEYTITHNLGSGLYSMVLSGANTGGDVYIPHSETREPNQFTVEVFDENGTLVNGAFYFILVFEK